MTPPQNETPSPSGPGNPSVPGWATPSTPPPPPSTAAETPTSQQPPTNAWAGTGSAPPFTPHDPTSTTMPPGGDSDGAVWTKRIAAGVAVVLLMVGSGATGAAIAGQGDDDNITRTVATVAPSSEPASQSLAKVAEAVQPSVVSIIVSVRGIQQDEGSGFIYHSDGTIVTNNHVISAAANNASATISVKFASGDTADARILGRDPATDIAVIKVDGVGGLTAARLGTSSSLHVGDTVLALGSPLGLDGSVTSGIVSALHRTVNLGGDDSSPFGRNQTQSQVADAIQTDAAINPGNSGGPLVNVNGEVVGINTAIASLGSNSTSGNIGVGFAIPIDAVVSIADQLVQGKTPQHALLGVQILDDENGALVRSVTSGGAAEDAGIKEGDVITKFGDTKITTADQLSAAVRAKKPGDKVNVTLLRDNNEQTVEVTLGSTAT